MVNQVNSTGRYQPVYSNDKKAEEITAKYTEG